MIGWDYQHVYPLGGNRYLWLFQDTFIDHSNTATTLGNATFTHNSALVQEGSCFRLLHRGYHLATDALRARYRHDHAQYLVLANGWRSARRPALRVLG